MSSYDEMLADAVSRRQQARHLDAKLQAVDGQVREMRSRVEALRRAVAKEEADVQRLERFSFAALLGKLSGRGEEKLSAERTEAYYARVRLDADTTRLEQLERTLEAVRQQRANVGDPDGDYAAALGAKERELASSGAPATIELSRIAEERARLTEQLREHDEAHQAGVEAQKAIRTVLTNIAAAHRAQGWDTISGGGIIGAVSQMKEYSTLENAERAAAQAQQWLDTFAAEMADIGIPADLTLPATPAKFQLMESFLDNMFTDMMRREEIGDGARRIEAVQSELHTLLERVQEERAVVERRRRDLIEQRNRLIAEA